jgi:hypothetical protein
MDDKDGFAKLRFMLENEIRTVEILTIPMKQLDEEAISTEISYRINSNKQRTTLVLQRLKDIVAILSEHNPAMIEMLQRAVSGHDQNTEQSLHLDASNFFDANQQSGGVKLMGKGSEDMLELPHIV